MAEETSGFISGAATGAQFGPIGFIVGGALGAIFGGRAGKKRRDAEYKALVGNTKQAYKIGESTYAGFKQTGEGIDKTFNQNVASSKARIAASGGQLQGASFQGALGAQALKRDESLAALDTEKEKYKKSEAFKFIKGEFDYLSSVKKVTGPPSYSQGNDPVYSIRTEGRTGESFFTGEQKKNLRSLDTSTDENMQGNFTQYQQSINPSFEQYEQSRFGSDEDKAQFESDMTQRITQANDIYDSQLVEARLEQQRKTAAQFDF